MAINLILAAGKCDRWKGSHPKQLAPFEGLPVIARTAKQIANSVVIITVDDRIAKITKNKVFRPIAYRWIVETILSTRDLWEERTRIFLGDVIYSNEAIGTIVLNTMPVAVFGRPWEIFGLTFDKDSQNKVVNALEETLECTAVNGRKKLWEFYRYLTGLPVEDTSSIENMIFQTINDWTNDIDTVEEYHAILNKTGHPVNLSEVQRWA